MRKLRYLAGGAVSLSKPFLLGAVAVGMGLSDSGGFASYYLRALIFPHIFPALCFLFLYYDEDKYRSFKPLAALFCAGSFLFLAAAFALAAANFQKLLLSTKNPQGFLRTAAAFLAAVLIDVICGILLVSDRHPRRGPKARALPDGGAPLSDKGR